MCLILYSPVIHSFVCPVARPAFSLSAPYLFLTSLRLKTDSADDFELLFVLSDNLPVDKRTVCVFLHKYLL